MSMSRRTWLKASFCLFVFLFSFVIPIGNFFPYGNFVQAEEVSSADASIENELLIYTPQEMLSFNIENYLQHNAPHLVEYAETISHWCGYSSISPKIIIALIEYQTGLMSNKQPDLSDMQKPLSSLSDSTGFSDQIKDVATQLADAYYSWRKDQQAPDQNILQNFLDEKSNAQPRTDQQSLGNLYYQLFPDLSEITDQRLQTPVYGAMPPDNLLQLPYPVGESWNFGGSHTNNGSGDYPQSSLDFNGGSWQWGTDTSDLWVVASHGGQVVVHSSCNVEVVGSDGWSTTYYHLDNVVVETNQTVSRNTPLANYADNRDQALCQGGSSTGPHVHFSLKYDGSYEHLDGVELSGFSVHTGRDSYDDDCDYFWLEKNGTKYCAWTNLRNPGVADTCSVPASLNATDIEESTATLNWGSVSSAQSYDIRYKSTSDNSWISTSSSTNSVGISGLGADTEYEFQVRTMCSDETSDYSSSAYFTTSGTIQECSVPAGLNANNISENSATLTWTEVSSATGYRIQYREVSTGTWTTVTSSSPSADISRLTAETQYECRVQTSCSGGDSDYSDLITFTTLSSGETETIGNTDIFSTTTNATNRRAVSYTMPADGTIQSITMYHMAGSGNMILAVYEGDSEPTNLLGKSETVAVAGTDGWQTVSLITPVFVTEGTNIWLSWVLEENSGILVYESGSIPRADAGESWSSGMPDQFGSSSLANYSYSIYATYEPGGTQDCAVPSGLEATNITQTSAVLRWNSVSSATGYQIQYRQPGEDWTTTTSSGASIELTNLTSDTLYEFQVQAICSFGDAQYSSIVEFATVGEQTSETIGHTTVFDTTTNVSNRRAVRYTMPSSGTIESITMYHLAGTGDMTLAVYEGDRYPTNLLAKTESVQVDDLDGWQTVNLQTPVHVDSGKKIWLAWVLEENSGIIVYRAGSVPRAHAVRGLWSAGMPNSYGYSRLANYDYSIYATYIPD